MTVTEPSAPTADDAEATEPDGETAAAAVAEEVLVEEISIDGMCGVY